MGDFWYSGSYKGQRGPTRVTVVRIKRGKGAGGRVRSLGRSNTVFFLKKIFFGGVAFVSTSCS